MLTYFLAILAGFALLIWSADRFVDGASAIAKYFGVSTLIVGMIVIGFGTSAPEMLVSGVAAYNGNPGLGIGNAIGSNIANMGLVLGITAMVKTLPVQSRLLQREIPILLAAEVAAYSFLYSGSFSRWDGVALLFGLGLVLVWMVYSAKYEPQPETLISDIQQEIEEEDEDSPSMIWAFIGLAVLLASSNLLVWGATNIATELGVSDLVIGLTIVAIGTSLPELAATLMSALKNETDLAIGNIVGSNIFNTLGVLAIPALLAPGFVSEDVLNRDMPIMILMTIGLLLIAIGCLQKKVLTWWKGAILFASFVGYNALLYRMSVNEESCHTMLCL